jgi:hypothetical protein
VLGLYLAGTSASSDEAVIHAYYSLLLDSNVTHAQVVARNAFEAAPTDGMRRTVYLFSLWKQHRAREAGPLLAELKAGTGTGLVPAPLIRALILMQTGETEAARASLAQWNASVALPEETALAKWLSGLLEDNAKP